MIRTFRKEDLDRIMKLWLDVNLNAHTFIDSAYWKDNYQVVMNMLPKADIYVYEDQGCVKGFVGIMEGYIAGIFVDPKEQSKGIGKVLLNHSKQIYEKLTLHVYVKNERALKFYTREGFDIIEQQVEDATKEEEYFMIWEKKSSLIRV